MDEIFTCICGNQLWSIYDGFLRCSKCGEEYVLEYLGGGGEYTISKPEYFNEKIRRKHG